MDVQVEYAGLADRWAGPGRVFTVHAWWNSAHHTPGQVGAAALRTLGPRTSGILIGPTWVEDINTDTYRTPSMNSVVRIRHVPRETADRYTWLASLRFTQCTADGCTAVPGTLVSVEDDGTGVALCYPCWKAADVGTLHWIQADGRLQLFKIKGK